LTLQKKWSNQEASLEKNEKKTLKEIVEKKGRRCGE